MDSFIKGIVLGVVIAAPVGPIGILCISRTLRAGALVGFASGMGAATADALYAMLAAAGLGAITSLITRISLPLHIVGALFLLYLGIDTLRPHTVRVRGNDGASGVAAAYTSALALTIVNPATIFSFIAIFAAGSKVVRLTPAGTAPLICGVFFGSALWWLFLAAITTRLRSHVGPRAMGRINLCSGLLLCAFAAYTLLHR